MASPSSSACSPYSSACSERGVRSPAERRRVGHVRRSPRLLPSQSEVVGVRSAEDFPACRGCGLRGVRLYERPAGSFCRDCFRSELSAVVVEQVVEEVVDAESLAPAVAAKIRGDLDD